MAKEKKSVHKVQMTEGKRNIIHQLLQEQKKANIMDYSTQYTESNYEKPLYIDFS